MARAVGIGGLFFRSDNPEKLGDWYRTYLGVDLSAGAWAQQAGPTVFAPFARESDYFPSDRQWMVNFRVNDLTTLIAALTEAGIEVETRLDWDSEIGRFGQRGDPEGNPVELWEPAAPAKGE
ncbi:VOC family protein [Qingshengfaniella alkalisoli]|uniref:VOC family protein n=1 Tax=Qingshengfaniella alkalisoli TaxID=2599296 RepID=A0A5B8J276_9RHOB|nr:VOC family protein [Qingshengfaniella alkalisoli]QDY68340.1 VOC family protein [Qingshengfaniella alkalisoli]